MMEKLRCCPFCGNEVKIAPLKGLYNEPLWEIFCYNINCAIKPSGCMANKKEIIEAWNRNQ